MEVLNNIHNAKVKAREEQTLSIPAKRILEKTKDIPSDANKLKRRWFWELLQNASDYNDEVKVVLELYPDKIIFKHNGKPFSAADARNLIAPDSGKDESDLKSEDTIGQFGTGFISTHVLSGVISVRGVLDEEGVFERFSFDLDRSGFNDKELLKASITNSTKQFESIGSPFIYQQGSFDSVFEFNLLKPLNGIDVNDVVKSGLTFIYDMLPFTLAFMPKVKSVKILNYATDFIDVSTLEFIPQVIDESFFNVKISKIDFKENESHEIKSFIYSDTFKVRSIAAIEGLKIKPYPSQLTKLFCALPMIGTEKFSFPVAINSEKFVPKTERNGIRLSHINTENRVLMENAVSAYKILISSLLKHNYLEGFYNIVCWDNCLIEDAQEKQWYKQNIINSLKDFISIQPIVLNTEKEMIVFNTMKLPYFPKEDVDEQLLNNFYGLTANFHPQYTPIHGDYFSWYNKIDFSVFGSVKYELKDLLATVQECLNLERLSNKIEHTSLWLNNLINLVYQVDEKLFDQYKIIPNQLGVFVLRKDDIHWDNDVDEELIDIYNILADDDYRGFLLHKSFEKNIELLPKERSLDTSKVAKSIDDLFSEVLDPDRGTDSFQKALRAIFSWFAKSTKEGKSDSDLKELFKWFSSKKPQLFLETFDDGNRDKVFAIAQSGKLDSLSKLAESNISSEDLNTITSNVEDVVQLAKVLENVNGGMNLLLQYAERIKQDDEDFKFKKAIGEKVERVFKQALLDSGVNSNFINIDHNGIGSHDFEITNLNNGKKFFIELKSYQSGSTSPLKLAPSQAIEGFNNPQNYCLAIIPRPAQIEQVTEEYIKSNLFSKINIGEFIREGIDDYNKVKDIETGNKLHLTFRDAIRINVEQVKITDGGMNFQNLIEAIKWTTL